MESIWKPTCWPRFALTPSEPSSVVAAFVALSETAVIFLSMVGTDALRSIVASGAAVVRAIFAIAFSAAGASLSLVPSS